MQAFAAAVELDYRYIESDVRTTADGVVVTFHDPRLDHLTGRPGRLRELPWTRSGKPGCVASSRYRRSSRSWTRGRSCGGTSTSRTPRPSRRSLRRSNAPALIIGSESRRSRIDVGALSCGDCPRRSPRREVDKRSPGSEVPRHYGSTP
jgi:Glycerophosphoryl diester phosphodiesterase family